MHSPRDLTPTFSYRQRRSRGLGADAAKDEISETSRSDQRRSVPKYDGYLDGYDGWKARGWAYDSERPYESVELDLKIGDQHVYTLKADEFRADLAEHQIYGNSRHGFSFDFPVEACLGDTLTAQIRGTDFVLNGSPMPSKSA
jgi:hypothetical protein